jgi:hypothetical protein
VSFVCGVLFLFYIVNIHSLTTLCHLFSTIRSHAQRESGGARDEKLFNEAHRLALAHAEAIRSEIIAILMCQTANSIVQRSSEIFIERRSYYIVCMQGMIDATNQEVQNIITICRSFYRK